MKTYGVVRGIGCADEKCRKIEERIKRGIRRGKKTKLNRNDKCFCGSGKKIKNCCWIADPIARMKYCSDFRKQQKAKPAVL